MNLKNNQRKFLRSKGQHLKPVIWIGQAGVTAAVLAELERALEHHELLKVKVAGLDRDSRDALVIELCAQTGAALVQRIGNIALLYRPASELPRILLPA